MLGGPVGAREKTCWQTRERDQSLGQSNLLGANKSMPLQSHLQSQSGLCLITANEATAMAAKLYRRRKRIRSPESTDTPLCLVGLEKK